MSKLFIIGNGVDLYYGLKTRVDHLFFDILKTKKVYKIYPNLLEWYGTYGVFWNNFEESLAEFDIDSFLYDNVIYPNYSSDHEYDRDEGIANINYLIGSVKKATEESLNEMIEKANADIVDFNIYDKGYIKLDKDDIIINFNYTDTIIKMPSIKSNENILHIHGLYSENQKLIYGCLQTKNHCSFNTGEDYYLEKQKQKAEEFLKSLEKNFQKTKLLNFLEIHKRCEEVIVLGHSLSEVDRTYFSIINDVYSPKKWYISYCKNDNEDKCEKGKRIKDLGFIKNFLLINCEDYIKNF